MNLINRREILRSIARCVGGGLAASIAGCSGETTVVAEGDPVTRRKNKDDAMNRMLNPIVGASPSGQEYGAGRVQAGPAPRRRPKNSSHDRRLPPLS